MSLYAVTNPATGEVESQYVAVTDEENVQALDLAGAALPGWAATNSSERARPLYRGAELYDQWPEELAAIITREMGKPKKQAVAEIDIVVSIYRYHAEHDQEVPRTRTSNHKL